MAKRSPVPFKGDDHRGSGWQVVASPRCKYLPIRTHSSSSETELTRSRFHFLSLVGDTRYVLPLTRQYQFDDFNGWVQGQSAPDNSLCSCLIRSCSRLF